MVCLSSSLLIIENSVKNSTTYQNYLRSANFTYNLSIVTSIAEGLDFCRTSTIDTVLLGGSISDIDGLAFLELLAVQNGSVGVTPPVENRPTVILIVTEGDLRIAVRAMKLGAQDYLLEQDLTPELLQSAVACGIEKTRLQLQLQERKLDDGVLASWRDITAENHDEGVRKQTGLTLQTSEQRYKALIDVTTQIVWNADADGTILNSNSGTFTEQNLELRIVPSASAFHTI